MTTHPKEKPILFSGPMVRAILDGTKTQTRRILKPQPKGDEFHGLADAREYLGPKMAGKWGAYFGYQFIPVPFQVGQRLWVRETWRPVGPWECREDRANIQFRADEAYSRQLGWPAPLIVSSKDRRDSWRPSIHMPRWASRIALEVTAVRVERLQDITEKDAKAEGVESVGGGRYWKRYPTGAACVSAVASFQTLWESIHGPGSWDQNPWVIAITFKRILT